MDGKRKMLLVMVFKVFLKNKWKRRKLKFSVDYCMTPEEIVFSQKQPPEVFCKKRCS